MTILERVKIIKPDADERVLEELINIVTTRILLRGGIKLNDGESFPSPLNGIAVDIAVSAYNRYQSQHEGVKTEKIDVWTLEFNDLIEPYEKEIFSYKHMREDESGGSDKKVKFI